MMAGLVPIGLIFAFFVTAVLYAAVGFGGGSTYAAILALSGLDYRLLPVLALACNIVVVAGSSIRFARAKITPWRGALTLTAMAAPAALLGGLTPIDEASFMLMLGASLVLTGASMILPVNLTREASPKAMAKLVPIVAVPLGYLAGLVGIGGGIFLAPLLHMTRWNNARAIAATASIFILVNSLFGLTGQLLKNGSSLLSGAVSGGLALIIAVAIGGQIGSLIAVRWLPLRWIRWLTAALVTIVGARMLIGV